MSQSKDTELRISEILVKDSIVRKTFIADQEKRPLTPLSTNPNPYDQRKIHHEQVVAERGRHIRIGFTGKKRS